MRLDWVPVSAAALVTGVMALAFAALLSPNDSSAAQTLEIARLQDGRWMVVAVGYFLGSIGLTFGLPSVMTLFEDRARGRTLSLVSALVLTMGFLGTAGYAMLMVFFRALAINGAIRPESLEAATTEEGLVTFLLGWVVAFVLGELLLAIALLRASATPRWVPVVLLVHVASVFVSSLLPPEVSRATVLLLAAAFSGIAMQAVARDTASRRI